jgi:hypothetical protein
MKRNSQRAETKQRRAEQKRSDRDLAAALATMPRHILEQLAGSDDDAKLARHRWIFNHAQGLPKCPDGVSHPQIQDAARAAIRAKSEMSGASAG